MLPSPAESDAAFTPIDGILVDPDAQHRQDDFDASAFSALLAMQRHHFWYKGRHAFVLEAMRQTITLPKGGLRVADLGGGCGGWLEYLRERAPEWLTELGHGDSSIEALRRQRARHRGTTQRDRPARVTVDTSMGRHLPAGRD